MAFGGVSDDSRLNDVARREVLIAMFEMPEDAMIRKYALIELMALAFRRGVSWQLEHASVLALPIEPASSNGLEAQNGHGTG